MGHTSGPTELVTSTNEAYEMMKDAKEKRGLSSMGNCDAVGQIHAGQTHLPVKSSQSSEGKYSDPNFPAMCHHTLTPPTLSPPTVYHSQCREGETQEEDLYEPVP